MNKDFAPPGKLIQLKSSIQKWFTKEKETEESHGDADKANRNAQELIWTFQERFGYSGIRRERDE